MGLGRDDAPGLATFAPLPDDQAGPWIAPISPVYSARNHDPACDQPDRRHYHYRFEKPVGLAIIAPSSKALPVGRAFFV
jgi:hypothetical protein